MFRRLCSGPVALALALLTAAAAAGETLRVAADGRYLATPDGRPFFWLGDTAWELFHRLNREEASEYLTRRAAQGFTIVQAVVLAERDGLRSPNPYGDVPFHALDPRRPNEAYFQQVDFIVQEAARVGLRVAMLPTWGDKVPGGRAGGGPVVFNPANAFEYGRFLGQRFRAAPVVWMLGGDRAVANDEAFHTWRAMALGLREGDGGAHLITYHPAGEETSALWFHNEPWLDFNVFQSGHGSRFQAVHRFAAELSLLQPRRPFLDAEPPYEEIPVRFWEYLRWDRPDPVPASVLDDAGLLARPEHFKRGLFDDHDARVHAYWSVLAGAAGHTYGHNAVWQMHRKGEQAVIPSRQDWRDALESPGARSMRPFRTLFERRSFARLRPDQSLLYGPNPDGPGHLRAALDDRREFALVYVAEGRSVEVVFGKVRGSVVRLAWFDPRSGELHTAGDQANTGRHSLVPPTTGAKQDWVLVIEALDAVLPPLEPAGGAEREDRSRSAP